MGQCVTRWVMGHRCDGSWVTDAMGQMGHGSPMLTHGPLWCILYPLFVCGEKWSEVKSMLVNRIEFNKCSVCPLSFTNQYLSQLDPIVICKLVKSLNLFEL